MLSVPQDGAELRTNTSSVFITEDDRALLLPDVRTSDAGHYSCRAENPVGSFTHVTELTIMVPPRLKVRGSGGGQVIRGESAGGGVKRRGKRDGWYCACSSM